MPRPTDNNNPNVPQSQTIEPVRDWGAVPRSLSTKLAVLLSGTLMVAFGVLGFVNLRLQQQHMQNATQHAAERVSEVIMRATSYYMLRNDRDGLHRVIGTIGGQRGITRVRIISRDGHINFSTDREELGVLLDTKQPECAGCHIDGGRPVVSNGQHTRIFRNANGSRTLGIFEPIDNQPSCSNAACHAHSTNDRYLGVLDTTISLAEADEEIKEASMDMVVLFVVTMIGMSLLIWGFIWHLVHRPAAALIVGTKRLAEGELGHQIVVESRDEIGELADSFNRMSLQLKQASDQATNFTHSLEQRVEQKTSELKRVYEQACHVETMASLGKMAAVVAHEVNNPLSGILTYSKLIKRWIDKGDLQNKPERMVEARQCLDLIESESRRCGELVRNLLMFSRSSPINLDWADLNLVLERCMMLVRPKLDLNGVQEVLDLARDVPHVYCDASQIEQVVLALVMNAIDAMPRGGILKLRSRYLPEGKEVELQVADDGAGIPPSMLPKIFEPFTTTKENGKGVGLGLAIAKNIIERHRGKIAVDSELGRGTKFYLFLPVDAAQGQREPASTAAAADAKLFKSAATGE